MWFFRWLGIFLLALFFLTLAMQNTELTEIVIYSWQSGPVPVYWIVFCSFAVGVLLALLISAVQQVQYRVEAKRYRDRLRAMQTELDRLRIISLEEGLSEVEELAGTEKQLKKGRGSNG